MAKTAQEIVGSGLTGVELEDALFNELDKLPHDQWQSWLDQQVTATVWHGTRRRESIEELRNGFCSYTKEQAIDWLTQAHQLLCEKTKVGPRVCKALDRHRVGIMYEVSQPHRGKFSVTGIENTACGVGTDSLTGKPREESLQSGWGDRNPEFVWDYLHWRAGPKITDDILTEMFGRPVKVKLKVQLPVRALLGPQDIHLEQRCFKPEEIISIEPCPPKRCETRIL